MTDETETPTDPLGIPRFAETEIATLWGDNIVAAQLTRSVVRSMVHQGKDENAIRDAIRYAGRLVE
jgi:hypothetical protein